MNIKQPQIMPGTVALMASHLMAAALSDPDVIEDLFGAFRNEVMPGIRKSTPRALRIEAIADLACDLSEAVARSWEPTE